MFTQLTHFSNNKSSIYLLKYSANDDCIVKFSKRKVMENLLMIVMNGIFLELCNWYKFLMLFVYLFSSFLDVIMQLTEENGYKTGK